MSILNRFRLNHKKVLVTGGSKGLGLAMADVMASVGADLVLVSRTLSECESACQTLSQKYGVTARAFACDVSEADQVADLYQVVTQSVGGVDVLVNSAGINIRGPIESLGVEDWDTVMNANLKGPFLMAKAFGPAMAERGWGRIVHMGSLLSWVGIAGRTPYASSKAGLLGLTRVLALEWADRGVTVNALCPGVFATEMNRSLTEDPEKFKQFVQQIPVGRWGELQEITAPALFLASDASSYMTGQTLIVDGGWTAK